MQAFHRGFYNDAWISLEKSISFQPTNTLAQAWLGRAQWKSGYEQEALRTWQQVLDSGKGSALVRDWIDVLTLRRGLGRELAGKIDLGRLRRSWTARCRAAIPSAGRRASGPAPDGTFWLVAFGSNEVLHFDANFRLLETLRGGLAGIRPALRHRRRRMTARCSSPSTGPTGSRGATRAGRRSRPSAERAARHGLLLGPQYMTMDSRGYLWVTDWGNSRVVRFAQDGTFVQAIPGITGPTGIAAHEDRLYVSDKTGQADPRLRPQRQPALLHRGGDPAGARGHLASRRRDAARGGRQPHPGVRPRAGDLDRAGRHERAHQEARPAGRHGERRRARRRLRPEQGRSPLRRHHALRGAGRARGPGELGEVPRGLRGHLGGEQVREARGRARHRQLHRHRGAAPACGHRRSWCPTRRRRPWTSRSWWSGLPPWRRSGPTSSRRWRTSTDW